MKKKSKAKPFFKILTILFIIFIALIITYESGYYESKVGARARLTNEAIKKFESDIQNGVAVDLNDYLEEEYVDYSNSVTKIGNKVTSGITKVITKGLGGVFDVLKNLVW